MNLGLIDKTALVLGSTSGLGGASATALADEGARVGFVGRRAEVAAALAGRYPGARSFSCDLEEAGSVDRLIEEATDEFGPIDILVLNSGGPTPGPAVGLSTDAVAHAMETLLLRQIELAQLVLPSMRARGWGRIVAIGSLAVQEPLDGLALSNIARSGLAGFLKTLSREVAADGVTVNMVLPGRIATDRVTGFDVRRATDSGVDIKEIASLSRASIPVGRYGSPEEFAAVVTFLSGVQASYITGEQIRCDGGLAVGY